MWDNKFNKEGYLYGVEPNDFIAEKSTDMKKGSQVICFGEGEGRNALYFLKKGMIVTALDPSEVGLKKALNLIEKEGFSMTTIHSTAENFNGESSFDYAISSFMHIPKDFRRAVFKSILNSLIFGGSFIGEFFSTAQLKYSSGGPKDIELLYDLEDMRELLLSLDCEIVHLEEIERELNEGIGHRGVASLIQVVFKKVS